MLIICAVGYNGSGKDTVLNILCQIYDLKMISIGDIVRDLTREMGLECTRENLNQTSLKYIKEYGRDFFPKKVIEIIENNGYENVCVSGIRTYIDVEVLKSYYKDKFFLIYVQGDENTRYNRLKNRGEERDPKDFNEFLTQEKNEEKRFQISKAIRCAVYTIDNNGSIEDLRNGIYKMIDDCGFEKLLDKHNLRGSS